MQNGEMLRHLAVMESELPELLAQPDLWDTLDVDYEPPRVERLFTGWGDFRIYLHRIHPCERALFHAHPWPSAIRILGGAYVMEVGYGQGDEAPPVVATTVLSKNSTYEMIHPDGWHSVRPFGSPSYSIMITGKPWGRSSPGKGISHQKLTSEVKMDLLSFFATFYRKPLPHLMPSPGE